MNNEDITILIPSYQPDPHLYNVCSELYKGGYQILIIDDGSGEDYLNIFSSCSKMAKIIHKPQNQGKGAALKDGFKQILDIYPNTKYVVTCDGDGQHKYEDIERVIKLARCDKKSVLSIRDFKGKIPLRSRVGNDMSKFVQTLITYRYLKDNQCGLRAFDVSLIPYLTKIKGNKYEYEMNVISSMLFRNIPFSTILIDTIYENNNSTSHFRPFLDTVFIQKGLFTYGLINIIFFLLVLPLIYIFSSFVFNGSLLNLELSVAVSSGLMMFSNVLLTTIIFRPKEPLLKMSKQFMFKIFSLIIVLAVMELLIRVCNFDYYSSYLIGGLLSLVPVFCLCLLTSK